MDPWGRRRRISGEGAEERCQPEGTMMAHCVRMTNMRTLGFPNPGFDAFQDSVNIRRSDAVYRCNLEQNGTDNELKLGRLRIDPLTERWSLSGAAIRSGEPCSTSSLFVPGLPESLMAARLAVSCIIPSCSRYSVDRVLPAVSKSSCLLLRRHRPSGEYSHW